MADNVVGGMAPEDQMNRGPKPMIRTVLSAIVVATCLVVSAKAEPLLLCGADKVFEINTSTAENGKIEKTWVWDAKHCEGLPESLRPKFATTDDCKPVSGGRQVLISSSSGACALVERASGKAIWYAQVANAHSLEILPRGRIVVASSVAPNGDRIVLFDIAHSNEPLWSTPLVSAHGVVWDDGRQLLWALGLTELRSYELKDWDIAKPSLALKATYPLPDENGHDMQAIPQSNDLVVTTARHVCLFDRDKCEFRLHPDLGDKADVKCVGIDPETGRTVFLQATESWWSDTLGLLNPAGKIRLPGEKLYKARWIGPPIKTSKAAR
jgi:hypothetical protein